MYISENQSKVKLETIYYVDWGDHCIFDYQVNLLLITQVILVRSQTNPIDKYMPLIIDKWHPLFSQLGQLPLLPQWIKV